MFSKGIGFMFALSLFVVGNCASQSANDRVSQTPRQSDVETGVATERNDSSQGQYEILDEEQGTGNAIGVQASSSEIIVSYYYSSNEQEGRIKIAKSYRGRKSDDGFTYARGGEVLQGEMSWADRKSGPALSQSFTVPSGGSGPAVFAFENPSSLGRPMNVVVRAVVKNDPSQTVIYPGIGLQWILFARRNDDMPKETEYLLTFIVEGDKVSPVDPQDLYKYGWNLSLPYWQEKDPSLFGDDGDSNRGLYK